MNCGKGSNSGLYVAWHADARLQRVSTMRWQPMEPFSSGHVMYLRAPRAMEFVQGDVSACAHLHALTAKGGSGCLEQEVISTQRAREWWARTELARVACRSLARSRAPGPRCQCAAPPSIPPSYTIDCSGPAPHLPDPSTNSLDPISSPLIAFHLDKDAQCGECGKDTCDAASDAEGRHAPQRRVH